MISWNSCHPGPRGTARHRKCSSRFPYVYERSCRRTMYTNRLYLDRIGRLQRGLPESCYDRSHRRRGPTRPRVSQSNHRLGVYYCRVQDKSLSGSAAKRSRKLKASASRSMFGRTGGGRYRLGAVSPQLPWLALTKDHQRQVRRKETEDCRTMSHYRVGRQYNKSRPEQIAGR